MKRCIPLEKAAEQVCMENSKPPLIFQLPPERGRAILDAAQDSPVYKYPADVTGLEVDAGRWGRIRVYVLIPEGAGDPADVILYMHGAGWVFGNLHTHDKLVRELAARTRSVVVFPEYSLSPEAKYPTAIEQCYAVLCRIPAIMKEMGRRLDPATLTVAGDSVGGNMAAVTAILAKGRRGPRIHKQLSGGDAVVLESIRPVGGGSPADHCLSSARFAAGAQRSSHRYDHQRAGGCIAGRGPSLRLQASYGGRGCDGAAIPGHHPRFCHAQRTGPDGGLPVRYGCLHRLDQPKKRRGTLRRKEGLGYPPGIDRKAPMMMFHGCLLIGNLPQKWRLRR